MARVAGAAPLCQPGRVQPRRLGLALLLTAGALLLPTEAIALVPNDPLFPQQWALQNDADTLQPAGSPNPVFDADVDAPLAWSIATGEPATRIAIIDSGVDAEHEDLAGRVVASETIKSGLDGNDNVG